MNELEKLPVPEHLPGFWDRLEAALHGTSRRDLPGWLWAPAAAVAVMAVGLASTLLLGGDGVLRGSPSSPLDAAATTSEPAGESIVEPGADVVAAPWNLAPLPESAVPAVLIEQWGKADNRTWCSGMFPESLVGRAGARSADFSGGWAVAFDTEIRSALGVAGTSLAPFEDVGVRWPHRIRFDDGAVFGWGGEGFDETNPRRLGELAIPSEGCVYQIWSELGDEPLIEMARTLRRVEGLEAEPVEWREVGPIEELGPAPWRGEAAPDVPPWATDLGDRLGYPIPVFALPEEVAGARIRPLASGAGMAWDLDSGPGHDNFNRPCADCGRGVIGFEALGGPAEVSDVLNQAAPGMRRLRWDDGSTAVIGYYVGENALPPEVTQFYDPETGEPVPSGYRALISIPGVGTFEMWCHLGMDHLVSMIERLRLPG